jgi:hypothetical protein
MIKLEQNNSKMLTIPNDHKNERFDLVSVDNSIKFPCYVDTNLSLICQKKIISTISESDIYFLNFKILANDVELTKINYGLLAYSNANGF